jgi:hypothetical protein
MSDQVIRYDSKDQYIEYKNHLRDMATGDVIEFPDWGEDPDAYWKLYYERMEENPEQIFEMWTLLEDEKINEDGSLDRQIVRYETLWYENRDEVMKSAYVVQADAVPDPGVPVSAEFKSRRAAERMRSLLMKGEPGHFYDIKHRTKVATVESGKAP